MKHTYKKGVKIKYNNQLFQVLIRDDFSYGFLKITKKDGKDEYSIPTALEFLHLSNFMIPNNNIKF